MFNCKDSIDLLLNYLDGDLTPAQVKELESHLGHCSPCVDFLNTYKSTPTLCRKALVKKMPSRVAEELTAFLRKHIKPDEG